MFSLNAAILGGGITGLFVAKYLISEGVDVTLFEKRSVGEASSHAAGLIVPHSIRRTNTWGYLAEALNFARKGVLRIREVDRRWWLSLITEFGQDAPPEAWDFVRKAGDFALQEYRKMAEAHNDFEFSEDGVLEIYESKKRFSRAVESTEREKQLKVESLDVAGYAGGIFYPNCARVCTESFTRRIADEIGRVRVVYDKVTFAGLDGTVGIGNDAQKFDAVIAALGVDCRKLGIPVTAIKGYGQRLENTQSLNSLPHRAIELPEYGNAIVAFENWVKVTGGLEFDFSPSGENALAELEPGLRVLGATNTIPMATVAGFRPCSPDGFPIVGRKENLVVATGAGRLGWSFAPALGRLAADLALGRSRDFPHLSRYARKIRSGTLV